jgi:hypothetical protein
MSRQEGFKGKQRLGKADAGTLTEIRRVMEDHA